MERRTRDDWRRSLIEKHSGCLETGCRWTDVACTGGTELEALQFEHDREAVWNLRNPPGFDKKGGRP